MGKDQCMIRAKEYGVIQAKESRNFGGRGEVGWEREAGKQEQEQSRNRNRVGTGIGIGIGKRGIRWKSKGSADGSGSGKMGYKRAWDRRYLEKHYLEYIPS